MKHLLIAFIMMVGMTSAVAEIQTVKVQHVHLKIGDLILYPIYDCGKLGCIGLAALEMKNGFIDGAWRDKGGKTIEFRSGGTHKSLIINKKYIHEGSPEDDAANGVSSSYDD